MRPPINTLFIGKTHHHLARVESTNDYLRNFLELSKEAVPEGLLISADDQTAGKGQGGKKWMTEPGTNLMLSILLKPVFLEPRHVFYLNKAVALAIHDTLATEIYGVNIKWPNDMYFENKKLAGVLIENVLGGSRILQSIIGIGINVNQQIFDENLPNPVSLIQITGRQTDLSQLCATLCIQLEKYYLQLRSHQFTTIDALYHHYLLKHQKENQFIINNELITATVNGVSAGGKLILSTADKKMELAVGEVEWIL